MAEEDAHGSKGKFERRMKSLQDWLAAPAKHDGCRPQLYQRKYWVRNPANFEWFHRFADVMDARDLSYIRRNRYLDVLLFLFAHTEKELSACQQEDINAVVAASHRCYRTRGSKDTFLTMLGCVLKALMPGRFVVEKRLDRSLEKELPRVSYEEVCRLVRYLRDDQLFRAFVTTMLETFARPQELVWRTMKDVEVQRRGGRPLFAKIRVSSHGKKGTKTLVVKDTLGYLMEWLERHPQRSNPQAFLFPNMADRKSMMRPSSVTMKLKRLQRMLGIEGKLNAYELKSRGITFSCLRHDPPKLIQARAGWANMDPLVHYDKTTADELLDAELAKEGLLDLDRVLVPGLQARTCECGCEAGFAEEDCPRCRKQLPVQGVGKNRETSGGEGPASAAETSDQVLMDSIARLLEDPKAKEQLKKLLAA